MSNALNNRNERVRNRERLIFNVTEDLLLLMEDRDVTKSELAKLLSRSKSFVSQILSGDRNMTLGTLADIVFVLDSELKIKVADESITHLIIAPEEDEAEVRWRTVLWQKPKPLAGGLPHVLEFVDYVAANEARDAQTYSWRNASTATCL